MIMKLKCVLLVFAITFSVLVFFNPFQTKFRFELPNLSAHPNINVIVEEHVSYQLFKRLICSNVQSFQE